MTESDVAAELQAAYPALQGLDAADLIGPRMTAWASRMAALPVTQKTWPPHWK